MAPVKRVAVEGVVDGAVGVRTKLTEDVRSEVLIVADGILNKLTGAFPKIL